MLKNVLIRKVPEVVHKRFKAVCAERGETMQGRLIAFMAEGSCWYTPKGKKEKKAA